MSTETDQSPPQGAEQTHQHAPNIAEEENHPQAAPPVFLEGLPLSDEEYFGREHEFDTLNSAWDNEHPHIMAFVAHGGMGKTMLVTRWLMMMEAERYRGAERVFGWSFQHPGASDAFFHDALAWFGDPDPVHGAAWNKGKRLAELIRQQRVLLILDGVEPLQYTSGTLEGRFKHPGMRCLLKTLGRFNPGVCVMTTRVPLKDLEHRTDTSVKQRRLPPLAPLAGAQLLESTGVTGTPGELRQTSNEFHGHPLALTLAGGYLKLAYDGNIRKRYLIPSISIPVEEGGDVYRVLEAYYTWLEETPELNLLNILSLFPSTRDTNAIEMLFKKGFLKSLLHKASIKGLTDKLHHYRDTGWKIAVTQLQDVHLVTLLEADFLCHPFIRDFFAEALRKTFPASWREAHHRLYDYYTKLPDHTLPDTLKELEPLLKAVYHGCQADLWQHTFQDVYQARIQRNEEHYLTTALVALSTDLTLLLNFFQTPYSRPVEGLPEETLMSLLHQAESDVLELERVHDAIELMRLRHEHAVNQADWELAACLAEQLSQCLLALGSIHQAITSARQSVESADKTGTQALKWQTRITLAYALRHAGHSEESDTALHDSHRLFQEHDAGSMDELPDAHHFMVCDVLLARGRPEDVQQRLTRSISCEEQKSATLRMGIDSLLRGKTVEHLEGGHVVRLPSARDALESAVTIFRQAGKQEYVIRGLLARAHLYHTIREFPFAWEDLEEAQELIEWNDMRVYLADYHFEAARVLYDEYVGEDGKFSSDKAGQEIHQRMHTHLEMAEALIWDTGYRVRDEELERLLTLLKDSAPEWVEEREKPPYREEITRAEVYKQVYLYPGELCVAQEPTVVWTLLGSCVAIVFYNTRLRLGAICHAQLPEENYRDGLCSNGCAHPCYTEAPDFERFKYVTCSIRYMFDQFSERGIKPDEIIVKLFGGSNVLQVSDQKETVGDKNLEAARKVIQEYDLNIVRESTGGTRGRTLYFYTDTGEVLMKLHRPHE